MGECFYTLAQYVDSKTSIREKILAYDLLITGMEGAYLQAISSGHLEEYHMDDGQMKVRATYRSTVDMNNALKGLITIRQMYINQYNGRIRVMRGGNLM